MQCLELEIRDPGLLGIQLICVLVVESLSLCFLIYKTKLLYTRFITLLKGIVYIIKEEKRAQALDWRASEATGPRLKPKAGRQKRSGNFRAGPDPGKAS